VNTTIKKTANVAELNQANEKRDTKYKGIQNIKTKLGEFLK
jgi:hypothetical protein